MVIDKLANAEKYNGLGEGISKALSYLHSTDFSQLQPGKYEIDGDQIFAVISEYQTKNVRDEKLESHRKYIDIQYIVSGVELMGCTLLNNQHPSREYDESRDFMLYDDEPDYFIKVSAGMFTIFYPTDLHMPSIEVGEPAGIKKVVMKIHV
jgi:YhcH/YjgK/YiaL family protein